MVSGLRPDTVAGSIWPAPVRSSKREREIRSRIISTFFISAPSRSRARSLRLIAFILSALPKRRMARSPGARYFSHSPHRNAIAHELPKIKELKCTLSLWFRYICQPTCCSLSMTSESYISYLRSTMKGSS